MDYIELYECTENASACFHYVHVPELSIGILGVFGFFGICLNVLTIHLWSTHARYVPSTYVFKSLAVANILYITFWFGNHVTWGHRLLLILMFSILKSGLYKSCLIITLILAGVRFITVYFPSRASELLDRRRLWLVVIGSTTFSLVADGLYSGYFILANDKLMDHPYLVAAEKTLHYIVPSAIEIVLMMTVLWRLWHKSSQVSGATSISMSIPGADGLSSISRVQASVESKRNARFVAYIVFAMCLMSLLAFQGPAVVYIVFTQHEPVKHYLHIATMVVDYICFTNAIIHFFFYLLIRKFRLQFLHWLNGLRYQCAFVDGFTLPNQSDFVLKRSGKHTRPSTDSSY